MAAAEPDMRRLAGEGVYSVPACAAPVEVADRIWRVRYFSPESEVSFCGHATIALAVALGQRDGPGI